MLLFILYVSFPPIGVYEMLNLNWFFFALCKSFTFKTKYPEGNSTILCLRHFSTNINMKSRFPIERTSGILVLILYADSEQWQKFDAIFHMYALYLMYVYRVEISTQQKNFHFSCLFISRLYLCIRILF